MLHSSFSKPYIKLKIIVSIKIGKDHLQDFIGYV